MKKGRILAITESAAMIALAVILSMIQVVRMPFGGSVTAAAMLPVILIAYRRKMGWGIFTASVYALLQMFLGLDNVRYGTTFWAVCAIIFLDYIFAFAVLGLAGMFRDKFKSQSIEILCGTMICCGLRYVCHVISGCTVWAGVSIPTSDGLIYSLAYNAAYMVPETIITLAAAWYLSALIDFRGEKLSVMLDQQDKRSAVLNGVGVLALLVGIVFDALYIFSKLQNEEGFDITGLQNANLLILLIVSVCSVSVWLILYLISKYNKSKA